MAMENGGLSASDVALMTNHGGYDMWGGNSMMWIFALLILAGGGFGGFGGWGNNAFANAIGYENLATSSEVQRGFDNQNLQAQTRDILSAVTSGTAQSVAATNQTFHDTLGIIQNRYDELQRDIGGLAVGQAGILAKQNECCCEQLRAIDGVNYNAAMNTASINATTTAQTQKILDALSANKIEELQNKVNALELQNAVAGVVRYPNSWTYTAGTSPFCGGCGCGTI